MFRSLCACTGSGSSSRNNSSCLLALISLRPLLLLLARPLPLLMLLLLLQFRVLVRELGVKHPAKLPRLRDGLLGLSHVCVLASGMVRVHSSERLLVSLPEQQQLLQVEHTDTAGRASSAQKAVLNRHRARRVRH